jgi:hypothetical protein
MFFTVVGNAGFNAGLIASDTSFSGSITKTLIKPSSEYKTFDIIAGNYNLKLSLYLVLLHFIKTYIKNLILNCDNRGNCVCKP